MDQRCPKAFLKILVRFGVSTVNILATRAVLKHRSVLLLSENFCIGVNEAKRQTWPHSEAANSNSVSLSDILNTLWETQQVCLQNCEKLCVYSVNCVQEECGKRKNQEFFWALPPL